MVRRCDYKYIYSVDDPPLLFDIGSDPNERTNLAGAAPHADLEAQLQSYVLQRWDSEALRADILLSQQRRRLVLTGDMQNTRPRWNHGEAPGSDVIWYRGEGSYNDWAFKYLPVSEKI